MSDTNLESLREADNCSYSQYGGYRAPSHREYEDYEIEAAIEDFFDGRDEND